jgi:predicted phosphodiesterase
MYHNTNIEDQLSQYYSFGNAREKQYVRFTLPTINNTVKLCFLSDIHLGSIFCDRDSLDKTVSKCLDENISVLLGGDLIEAATRNSIGSGVYDQNMNPNEQILQIMEIIKPLAQKGLVKSIIRGNHEDRFKKDVGIDICSMIAYTFSIPYMGSGGFHYIMVDDENYVIYYEHGSGGSKFVHTKISKVSSVAKYIEDFDIFAWGHMHDLVTWQEVKRKMNKRYKTVEKLNRTFLITGHYLNYEGSYANTASMPPSRIGSPIVTLHGNQHKIEVEEYTP